MACDFQQQLLSSQDDLHDAIAMEGPGGGEGEGGRQRRPSWGQAQQRAQQQAQQDAHVPSRVVGMQGQDLSLASGVWRDHYAPLISDLAFVLEHAATAAATAAGGAAAGGGGGGYATAEEAAGAAAQVRARLGEGGWGWGD